MKANSPAKSAAESRPAPSVPSRPKRRMPRCAAQAHTRSGRADRAQAGLPDRRDAGVGDLDRHLLQAPGSAQHDHQGHGGGIEVRSSFHHASQISEAMRPVALSRR
jgi:hypothetical protein